MTIFREKANSDDYDLASLFDKFNHLCFNGSLVRNFPLVWGRDNLKNSLGYVKINLTARKIENLTVTNRFLLDPDELAAVLVHEMVHVHIFQKNLAPHEKSHGPTFNREIRRIKAMGHPAALAGEIKATTLASHIKPTKTATPIPKKPSARSALYFFLSGPLGNFGIGTTDAPTDAELSGILGKIARYAVQLKASTLTVTVGLKDWLNQIPTLPGIGEPLKMRMVSPSNLNAYIHRSYPLMTAKVLPNGKLAPNVFLKASTIRSML